jgi:glutamate-ammonia-ligase adenylyltransferase
MERSSSSPGRREFGEWGPSPCRYVLLGLGKLGGREISYHSDLDLLLIYETDGVTARGESNSLYFTELAQRVIRWMSRRGPMGRLYEVDMRLRPTGKSGALVLPLTEFRRYFEGPDCQLWERQSLGRARVVRGEPPFANLVMETVRDAMLGLPWSAALVDELAFMRQRLEAGPRNLKRGPGGIVDVEFAVQLLQLKYGGPHPEILEPNIWCALDALESSGVLPPADARALGHGYSFLRLVEARLRLVTDRALTELPEANDDQEKLARRLGFDSPEGFFSELKCANAGNRAAYEAIVARERKE